MAASPTPTTTGTTGSLKNNVINAWWKAMIQERDDVVALDSAIIQHPRTWEASGHLAGFTDPLIDCRTCKQRFRADHIEEARAGSAEHPDVRCGHAPSKLPGDHKDCDLTEAREFNLMFETSIGPVKDAGSTVYLRPETAQGIFLDFKTTLGYARRKPPFGIAQVGKSFRNEITRQLLFARRFEQMAMEFFGPRRTEHLHSTDEQRMDCSVALGLERRSAPASPRRGERSHYSSPPATRILTHRWSDLEGFANRGDRPDHHADHPGRSSSTGTRGRALRAPRVEGRRAGAPCSALRCNVPRDDIGGEAGPCSASAAMPRSGSPSPTRKQAGMPERAREIYKELRRRIPAEFDAGGSIGKRYRRQDEIGTPYGVTVDGQTIEDGTVTVRDRDTLEQDRVPAAELADELARRLS